MRIELAAWKVEYIDLLVLLLPALVARSWFFGLFRKFAFILVVRAVRSLFHAHAQCALLLFYQNLIEFRSSFFCRRHSKLWIRNEYFMHGHNEIRQLNDGNLIYEFIFSRNICTYTYKCLPKEQSHNIVTFDLIQLVFFFVASVSADQIGPIFAKFTHKSSDILLKFHRFDSYMYETDSGKLAARLNEINQKFWFKLIIKAKESPHKSYDFFWRSEYFAIYSCLHMHTTILLHIFYMIDRFVVVYV